MYKACKRILQLESPVWELETFNKHSYYMIGQVDHGSTSNVFLYLECKGETEKFLSGLQMGVVGMREVLQDNNCYQSSLLVSSLPIIPYLLN
jgi:hypothetical protein